MDFLLQFPQQHAAKKAVDTCTLCIPFVNVWRYGKKITIYSMFKENGGQFEHMP